MVKKMKRTSRTAAFKFKVAIEALKGEKTTPELCQEFGIVSSQLFAWRKAVLDQGSDIFFKGKSTNAGHGDDVENLHVTIGRLKVENDFLSKVLGKSR